MWVALLSWPLLREKPSGGVWMAIVCAVAGVALVQQPGGDDANLGALVILFGSMATAVAMIGLHRLTGIDVRAVVAHFSAVATLFCRRDVRSVSSQASDQSTMRMRKILLMLLGVGVSATIGQFLLTKAFTSWQRGQGVGRRAQPGRLCDAVRRAVLGAAVSAESLLGHGPGRLAHGLADRAGSTAARQGSGGVDKPTAGLDASTQAILHKAPFGEAVVQRSP